MVNVFCIGLVGEVGKGQGGLVGEAGRGSLRVCRGVGGGGAWEIWGTADPG